MPTSNACSQLQCQSPLNAKLWLAGARKQSNAGSAGGSARCAPILASGGAGSKFVNCAWINGKSALVLTFQSYSAGDAQTLVPQILTAMTKG